MATTRHTISLFVENHPGVLVRVAGLFARRGYNIESLAVGPTERPEYSRMTIVVAIDKSVEQLLRQVQKLVPVVEVYALEGEEAVDRELMLVKVQAGPPQRAEIRELVTIFRARIVDVSATTLMIEATGTPDKLTALEENLRPYGIEELCRTGRIALERGPKSLPHRPHEADESPTATPDSNQSKE